MEEGMGMEEGLPDKRARVGIARLGHSHGNLEVLQAVMCPYAGAMTSTLVLFFKSSKYFDRYSRLLEFLLEKVRKKK